MTTRRATLICLALSVIFGHVAQCTPVVRSVTEEEEEEYDNIRLPNDTVPIHYNIALVPYIDDNFTFDGETNVDLKVLRPTADVVLHAFKLNIEEAATTLVAQDGAVFVPQEHVYNNSLEFLIIRFEAPLEVGEYTLNLKYNGSINNQLVGFYRTFYLDDEGTKVWGAATHFEAISARMAFPCWDEPALKATFNVSVKHHPKYTVISNMPIALITELDETDGKMWTYFEKSPLMSTYLVDFIVADYVRVSNADGSVGVWCRPNAVNRTALALEYAEKIQAELTRYTNSTVRVPKMDHIAIPQYSSKATEHWGAITYLEDAILYDEKTNTIKEKQGAVMVIAHELVHQWFGNIVSPLWWKDLWLSEAFAVYYQSYVTDKVISEWRIPEYFVVSVLFPMVFRMDSNPAMPPVSPQVVTSKDITKTFHFITYRKGASIVRMMAHILTEDVFHQAILDYLEAHEYGVARSEDLLGALQKGLDESGVLQDDTFNMTEAMLPWIEESNYPLVTVVRNYTSGDITISQKHISHALKEFESIEKKDTKWWVPINFATQSNPYFSRTTPSHWLKPTDEGLTITGVDVNDWVIVNIQHTGYYRVNYDVTNWRRLGKYLNSENYTNIHPLNRAAIINGAFEMLRLGHLSPTVFLEITNYLSREKDFIPWQSAFEAISSLSMYILHPECDPRLKSHVLSLMRHVIDEVGYEEMPGESDLNKLQRIELRQQACALGDISCMKNATNRLLEYAENPNDTVVPSDLHEWVFCWGMRLVNATAWRKLLDVYIETKEPWLPRYLSCSNDPAILEDYLNLLFDDDSPVQREHAEQAFYHLVSYNTPYFDMALDFYLNHTDKIQSIFSDPYTVANTFYDAYITRSQYDRLSQVKFLTDRYIDKPWKLMEIEKNEKILSKIRDAFPKDDVSKPATDNSVD